MGCRTRANEYYATMTQRQVQLNRHTEHTVEGNVVRKSVPKKQEPVRIRKRKKKTTSISAAKALASQRRRLIALGAIGSVIFIALCAVMLNSLEKGNALAMEVESKESELNALTVANDAREYEIDSSVDLNYVIEVATQELGMVRSNLSQVVTYSTKNSEYLQQLAKVPAD